MKMELPELKYDERGLIPAIAQDATTGQILMQAYMNEEALRMTIETGFVHYYSRSRQALWRKGETSGNQQILRKILVDCDLDSLVVKVDQTGPACHTGEQTCFYRELNGVGEIQRIEESILNELVNNWSFKIPLAGKQNQPNQEKPVYNEAMDPRFKDKLNQDVSLKIDGDQHILEGLYQLIQARKEQPISGSYTNYLFEKGLDKILKKVGEETTEVVIAAKNHDKEELSMEVADLLYHVLVGMVEEGVSLEDVYAVLRERHKK